MSFTAFKDIPLENCKGVLTDLDNTLYAYEPAHQAALAAAYAANAMGQSFEVYASEYRAARDAIIQHLGYQGACRSRFFAFQALAEKWKISAPFTVAADLEKAYWDRFIEVMTPDPEALAFLQRCKAAGKPVCIVSDMTATIQVRKLRKLGIENLINYLVTSEEVGIEKPDPRMFQAGLRKLGLSAGETIMLGDDGPKDFEGALAVGIKAYLVQVSEGTA